MNSNRLTTLIVTSLLNTATDATLSDALETSWPRCHAFACLRLLFWSTALYTEAGRYHAQGMAACINALAAPQWEVRGVGLGLGLG